MKVSVVIVSWNSRDELKTGLQSFYRETKNISFEVIIVDNASSDGTPEMVEAEYPEISLIRNTENIGFARATNMGLRLILRKGTADYALLLNPDIQVTGRAVERMASYLDKNLQAGCVAPVLVLPDGKYQIGAAGFFPSAGSGFHHFFLFSRLFPTVAKSVFISQLSFAGRKEAVPVEWLSGACLMVRRSVLERAGILDERYFFTGDDLEWGKRMKAYGIFLHYLPWIQVVHSHNISHRRVLKFPNTAWLRVLYSQVRNDRGWAEYFLFRAFSAGGFLLRLMAYTLLPVFGKKNGFRQKQQEILAYLLFSLTVSFRSKPRAARDQIRNKRP